MPLKIFITGANSGIGEALAIEYAKQGAILGLVARRKKELQILQKKLNGKVLIYEVDVTNINQCRWASEDFIAHHGTPDIVIANAGISTGTLTENFSDIQTFKKIIDTNLNGVINTFYPFVQLFKKREQGQFVGISSIAGIRGLPGSGAYSSSKAALINYLESFRVEMAPYKIDVTTIAPGYIKTPMTDVNDYSMPFIMPVNKAAISFINAIRKKKKFIIIPWQMKIIGYLMHILPIFIWDFLAKKGPRKKRNL
jgi:short-subunit dehydrogenase